MAVHTPEMFGKQTEREMGAHHPAPSTVRWIKRSHHRTMLNWYAKIRSLWFELYSFDGGLWHGGDTVDGNRTQLSGEPEYVTKHECAEQIVIYSKWMLIQMRKIGRTPIVGDNTGLSTTWTPTCDAEWEASMKSRYSLYLTVEDLYNATAHIVAGREINEDDIQVKELTAG